jgi:oligopeptide transport system permease protein
MIGVTLGMLAGSFGGWIDYIIMRLVEVFTAIPCGCSHSFLMSVWRGSNLISGGGLFNVILAIGLISWVDVCRWTRAITVFARKGFILASQSIGATRWYVARTHMLPNALGPLIVAVTLGVPTVIFTSRRASSVSGSTIRCRWGKMIADSLSYVRVYWYLGLFPTMILALTMLSFSFVGDGLRDALDPRMGAPLNLASPKSLSRPPAGARHACVWRTERKMQPTGRTVWTNRDSPCASSARRR